MKNFNLLIILLSCQLMAAQQQPGDIDTTFKMATFNGIMSFNTILDIVQKTDGKILAGTTETTKFPSVDYSIGMVSFNSDGSEDTSFKAPDEIVNVRKIILQPDGKIIIIGNLGKTSIARLNSDGSFDSSFNAQVNTDQFFAVQTAVLQSDGKIVIAGNFDTVNGIPRNKLARINTDGSLDEGFNASNGLPEDNYNELSVFKQPNEKIIIAGRYAGISQNESKIDLALLNADGSLDNSFICQASLLPDGGIAFIINSVQTQTDGKILITGGFLTDKNISAITRLNANGSIDATFNPGIGAVGAFEGTTINQALIEDSGKIVLLGNFEYYHSIDVTGITSRHIVRINTDGSVDTSFDKDVIDIGNINGGTIQTDRKILVGGRSIVRLIAGVNLGLTSAEMKQNILIYPNPVKNTLTVKSKTPISEIEIYNNIGQKISHQKDDFLEKNINMQSFSSGIYFVKITSDKKTEVRKIIKD